MGPNLMIGGLIKTGKHGHGRHTQRKDAREKTEAETGVMHLSVKDAKNC